MNCQIEFKPRAIKDLKALPVGEQRRIVAKAEALHEDLVGDVKKLTNFTPGALGGHRADALLQFSITPPLQAGS